MNDVHMRVYVPVGGSVSSVGALLLWGDVQRVVVNCAVSAGVTALSVSCQLSGDDAPLVSVVDASGNWGGMPCVWSAPVVRVYKNGLYCAQLVGGGYTVHMWRYGVHDVLWRAMLSGVADRVAIM